MTVMITESRESVEAANAVLLARAVRQRRAAESWHYDEAEALRAFRTGMGSRVKKASKTEPTHSPAAVKRRPRD